MLSPPIPYAVRTLALSHAQAGRAAFWTAVATAAATGFGLSPLHWLLLGVTAAVCGAAVRMVCAQLVAAWLAAHPDRLARTTAPTGLDPTTFDGATRAALAGLVRTLP